MKTFEVEISLYPQIYTVAASNKDEAIQKAKDKFYEANDGSSVYAIENVEQIEQ